MAVERLASATHQIETGETTIFAACAGSGPRSCFCDADVLICAQYFEYRRFNSPTDRLGRSSPRLG